MINNWKLGIRSMRYAYGIKSNLLMGILFAGVGICWCLMGNSIGFFGRFMLMSAALLPAQLIYSLNASNMVASSPVRRKMQTSVPATITCSCMLFIYTAMTMAQGIMACGHPEALEKMGEDLVLVAVMMALLMVYLGLAYKFFFFSMAMVVAAMLFLSSSFRIREWLFAFRLPWSQEGWGAAVSALAGLGIIIAGGFGQYLLSLLFYRFPLSKMAQSASLRREL